MLKAISRTREWLLPFVLILFVLELVTFPFVVSMTYSGRSESPDHVLNYTTGKLVWDDRTGIDENGAARLSLFDTAYEHVSSADDEHILAPGTCGQNVIRLDNKVSRVLSYKAVLYKISSSELLDIDVTLSGEAFKDTEQYVLPEGVKDEQVIRAVEGTVTGRQMQDFDITWSWQFEGSAEQDVIDTILGNRSAENKADDVQVGFYLVVTDQGPSSSGKKPMDKNPTDIPVTENKPPLAETIPSDSENLGLGVKGEGDSFILPILPMTGDTSMIEVYLLLLLVSGSGLFVLMKKEITDEK